MHLFNMQICFCDSEVRIHPSYSDASIDFVCDAECPCLRPGIIKQHKTQPVITFLTQNFRVNDFKLEFNYVKLLLMFSELKKKRLLVYG